MSQGTSIAVIVGLIAHCMRGDLDAYLLESEKWGGKVLVGRVDEAEGSLDRLDLQS